MDVRMRGWLKKKGGSRHNWTRRKFQLGYVTQPFTGESHLVLEYSKSGETGWTTSTKFIMIQGSINLSVPVPPSPLPLPARPPLRVKLQRWRPKSACRWCADLQRGGRAGLRGARVGLRGQREAQNTQGGRPPRRHFALHAIPPAR